MKQESVPIELGKYYLYILTAFPQRKSALCRSLETTTAYR